MALTGGGGNRFKHDPVMGSEGKALVGLGMPLVKLSESPLQAPSLWPPQDSNMIIAMCLCSHVYWRRQPQLPLLRYVAPTAVLLSAAFAVTAVSAVTTAAAVTAATAVTAGVAVIAATSASAALPLPFSCSSRSDNTCLASVYGAAPYPPPVFTTCALWQISFPATWN